MVLKRDANLTALPDTAQQLLRLVDDPMFRWYASVSAPHLSGRLDGLQVCTLGADGAAGTLGIGSAGRDETRVVRDSFRAAAEGRDSFEFGRTPDEVFQAAQIMLRLAEARRSGPLRTIEPEHRLEAHILRDLVEVRIGGGARLEHTSQVGQFPARFSPGGTAKFVDLLMRDGSTPWVVELKVLGGGIGKYLRHAIAQAVLYRHFVRGATGLHPWFEQLEPRLDPGACRAAVAFPRPTGGGAERRIDELRGLAELLAVDVIELDVNVDDVPPDVPPPLFESLPDGERSPDYRVLVTFATEPDDPDAVAEEIQKMLGPHELAIVEEGDIDVALEVFADGVFRAARTAMDRVESALTESSFGAPELLAVEVEGIFPWAEEPDEAETGVDR